MGSTRKTCCSGSADQCCVEGDLTQSKDVKSEIRRAYGARAREAKSSNPGCGCGTHPAAQQIGYEEKQLEALPENAVAASAGCGNPTAIAGLKRGEVVLDLGSGGGIDVFLAAKNVGPEGKAIGVDMTPDMIDLARDNARKAGLQNVEFRLGEIEHLPIADESVDVIISNCVINLSPEKEKVFREAYRVLRRGGRMLVSDVMVSQMPDEVRENISTWASCIGGAIELEEYTKKISEAGFTDIRVINNTKYSKELIKDSIAGIECSLAEDEKTILHKAEESFSISHADIQAVKT